MRPAPTLVLMYHRVAAPERDVHALSVHPDRFADQLAHLRARERPIPLGEARDRSRHRRVAITFDDGYADNALVARPLLEEAGVPATFFITAGLVGLDRERWWDELELLLFGGTMRARHLRLHIAGDPLLLDVGSEPARERAHWAIYHRLRPLRTAAIEDVIAQVRRQVDAPSAPRPSHRFMTADELRATATSGHVEIGGHATTHQLLASLPADEQRDEIVGGRERLRALTGTDVTTFAYPFGGPGTFDDTTAAIVEEAGYDLACAGWRGLVTARTDRWRLPRVVVKDWDRQTFAARLEAWFED